MLIKTELGLSKFDYINQIIALLLIPLSCSYFTNKTTTVIYLSYNISINVLKLTFASCLLA